MEYIKVKAMSQINKNCLPSIPHLQTWHLFFSVIFWQCSYFSTKTYVVGTHYKHIIVALLMSNHNIWVCARQNLQWDVWQAKTDQSAHPRSLMGVFADRMCLLQPPGYSKRNKREVLPYWVNLQADLSLCWSHWSYCKFFRVLAHIILSWRNKKIFI